MEPLIITAHLATGVVMPDPWSPSLDGILAYWAAREVLGEEEFALGTSGHRELVEIDLPLAREEYGDWWWWQVSSPLITPAERSRRAIHRRFDDAYAYERVPETVKRVETKGGPYKLARIERTVTHAPSISWHCVGDEGEIRRLLRYCANVGWGHTRGYGAVWRWDIEPGEVYESARHQRPLPAEYAERVGLDGARLVWGIRPPGRDPRVQTLCVMP
jgi:CRISPR type IV-associated protein Csf3